MDEKTIILEQYKLYVEMADRVSQRRVQINQYYVGLLTGILFVVAFIIDKGLFEKNLRVVDMILSIFGVLICITWQINILSYKKLNTAKFKVVEEFEKSLPITSFTDEWKILTNTKKRSRYISLSFIENFIPILMLLIFISLFFYSIIS